MFIFSLLFLAVCSMGLGALTQACAAGKIKLNPVAGIRTSRTMVNQKAWEAGHAAAVQPTWVSAIAAAAISLAGLLFLDSPQTQTVMMLLACALLLVAVAYGVKVANVAAVEAVMEDEQRP